MTSSLTERQIQSAFRAIAGCFFVLGLLIPTMFAQFPIIRDTLEIEEWQITFFILSMAMGAIPSMLLGSVLIGRIGSRRVSLIFAPLVLIFPILFVLAPSYQLLLCVGVGLGICTGFFDVSANSQGSLLERVTDRLFMTSIHALFALGVLVGSGLATLSHLVGLPLIWFFSILTFACVPICLFIYHDFLRFDVEHAQETQDQDTLGQKAPRFSIFLLVALSLLMLLGIEAEASHYDWLALYFSNEFLWNGQDLPEFGYNLAMVLFSSGLFLARALGDQIALRIGRPMLLFVATLIGLVGLIWLIFTQAYIQGLIASFLMGFGFAFFFPIFVAAAGRLRGVRPSFGVALVSAMGWASVFLGPPLIGYVENYYGFRWAYATIVPVAVFVAIFGPWVVYKSRPGNH